MSAIEREREVLLRASERYERLGYKVIAEPSREDLPAFFGDYQPDAVAVGVAPNVVIQVVEAPGRAAESGVKEIRRRLQGHDEWRLDVVYLSHRDDAAANLRTGKYVEALEQLKKWEISDPGYVTLMLWSVAEGLARNLEPELASRSLSPLSLVDLLVSNGYASQSEGMRLRHLAKFRNQFVHGGVDVRPDKEDIEHLRGIVSRLIERSTEREHESLQQ